MSQTTSQQTNDVDASAASACYTEEALRKLAIDIDAGRVFGTWNLPAEAVDMAESIFMVLFLANQDQLPKDAVHVYEYINEAGPLSVNGYPTFFSARFLSRDDVDRLMPMLEQLRKSRAAFLSV